MLPAPALKALLVGGSCFGATLAALYSSRAGRRQRGGLEVDSCQEDSAEESCESWERRGEGWLRRPSRKAQRRAQRWAEQRWRDEVIARTSGAPADSAGSEGIEILPQPQELQAPAAGPAAAAGASPPAVSGPAAAPATLAVAAGWAALLQRLAGGTPAGAEGPGSTGRVEWPAILQVSRRGEPVFVGYPAECPAHPLCHNALRWSVLARLA